VRRHLLPSHSTSEEAAFLFCDAQHDDTRLVFRVVDTRLLPPHAFAHRSPWFLELTDATRGALIKHAHDLGAALVECHSHPDQIRAEFSPSDLTGFQDFVPHVRWRLNGRPYAALVFARDNFDALVWNGQSQTAQLLRAIDFVDHQLRPTGATLDYLRSTDD
jgi:hypothetical protein